MKGRSGDVSRPDEPDAHSARIQSFFLVPMRTLLLKRHGLARQCQQRVARRRATGEFKQRRQGAELDDGEFGERNPTSDLGRPGVRALIDERVSRARRSVSAITSLQAAFGAGGDEVSPTILAGRHMSTCWHRPLRWIFWMMGAREYPNRGCSSMKRTKPSERSAHFGTLAFHGFVGSFLSLMERPESSWGARRATA